MNYKLYHCKTITDNYDQFINDCNVVYNVFKNKHNSIESTWLYTDYNLFSISATSALFYDLYKEINIAVRDYVQSDKRLWIQSWINMHYHDEVLDWHNHVGSEIHGYVSVDPKNTTTEFSDWKIDNKPGLLYIGPSNNLHRVVVNEPYDGYRITIAFDISSVENSTILDKTQYPLL